MNTKTWIIFGVVCVALLGGLIAVSKKDQAGIDLSSVNVNTVLPASDQNGKIADHVEGDAKSKVILVEYGDFQCPSCGGAHPGIKKITEDYGDKISFVFRNFPLTSIHPNALAAAAAAEAAGIQGKYWEMHNMLYEQQNTWSNASSEERTTKFVAFAQQLNLDTTKFREDLASDLITKKINFDQATGKKLEVSATPSFFLNGEKVDSEISGKLVQGDASAIRELLSTKLKENGVEPPATTE